MLLSSNLWQVNSVNQFTRGLAKTVVDVKHVSIVHVLHIQREVHVIQELDNQGN